MFLSNNGCPTVINSNCSTIDLASTPAIGQVHAERSNFIDINVRCLDCLQDSLQFLHSLDIDAGSKGINNVGLHTTHHQSVALNSHVTIVSSSVLGQPNKTVLTSCVSST